MLGLLCLRSLLLQDWVDLEKFKGRLLGIVRRWPDMVRGQLRC